MKVAVYDNPTTFRREAWADGRMEGFISFETLSAEGFRIHKLAGKIPWIIDDSPIVPGRIRGDKDAIRKAKGGRGMSKRWHVIPSPTDPEMFAVKCHYEYGEFHPEYLVADVLPIEDATLIAAAPMMHEALEWIVECCDVVEKGTVIADFGRVTPMDKARAALKAAKGAKNE